MGASGRPLERGARPTPCTAASARPPSSGSRVQRTRSPCGSGDDSGCGSHYHSESQELALLAGGAPLSKLRPDCVRITRPPPSLPLRFLLRLPQLAIPFPPGVVDDFA